MKTGNIWFDYIYDLIEIKYITKEVATNFADGFKKKKKLSEEEYKSIMLLIEATYEDWLNIRVIDGF